MLLPFLWGNIQYCLSVSQVPSQETSFHWSILMFAFVCIRFLNIQSWKYDGGMNGLMLLKMTIKVNRVIFNSVSLESMGQYYQKWISLELWRLIFLREVTEVKGNSLQKVNPTQHNCIPCSLILWQINHFIKCKTGVSLLHNMLKNPAG